MSSRAEFAVLFAMLAGCGGTEPIATVQQAARAEQAEVCHRLGDGQTVVLRVNGNALAAFFARGDHLPFSVWPDNDDDSFGYAAAQPMSVCTTPAGFVTNHSDCNDASSSINPSAAEVCGNGIDDNCNGSVDEGCIPATLEPTADSVITVEGGADTNRGSQTWLFTAGNPWGLVYRSLMAFDLTVIPVGTTLSSAYLNLRMVDQAGSDFSVQVREVLEGWTELGVTWNNQPSFSSSVEASVPYQGYGWWRFDVTDLVQRWVDHPAANHGLILTHDPEYYPDGGRFARFDSREGTYRPFLEIAAQ